MVNVTDLSWLEEEKISPRMLLLSRRITAVVERLEEHIVTPVNRVLLGVEEQEPSTSEDIRSDILIAQAWLAAGNSLEEEFTRELEERAKQQSTALWVDAARLHVLTSSSRELKARMALSIQQLPYIFPGELSELHVEMFSVGDRALHVLHVEWLKKLTGVAVESLELDCQHVAAWLLPFLEILPEKALRKQIAKVGRKRRLVGGGIGLLAFYAGKIGAPVDSILQRGDRYDQLFYEIAKESERHHLA